MFSKPLALSREVYYNYNISRKFIRIVKLEV